MYYRIGICTVKLPSGKAKNDGVGNMSMCRKDAPIDWHTHIFEEFSANSWQDACQYFINWRKTTNNHN